MCTHTKNDEALPIDTELMTSFANGFSSSH